MRETPGIKPFPEWPKPGAGRTHGCFEGGLRSAAASRFSPTRFRLQIPTRIVAEYSRKAPGLGANGTTLRPKS
jgi:hypothetical protein